MKLRSTIRAPVRFGEAEVDPMDSALYNSIRASREKAAKKPKSVQPVVSNTIHRPVPAAPSSVSFDPTLPPAVFPSLKFGQRPVESSDATSITDWSVNSELDDPVASLPLDQLDNYVVSNNESNPVYVKNMEIFASLPGDDSGCMFEDSDLDEPMDASEALGAKVCIDGPGVRRGVANFALNMIDSQSILGRHSSRSSSGDCSKHQEDVKLPKIHWQA